VKRRRSERGAAMVEALIVIPALVVVNGALLYMTHVYDAKLVTMRRSADATWSSAASGCAKPATGEGARPTGAAGDGSLGALGGQAAQVIRTTTVPAILAPFVSLELRGAGARADADAEGNSVFGGETLASDVSVLCNERPRAVSKADEALAVDELYRRFVR